MLPLVEDPTPRILPLPVVGLLLTACLGGSWFMVPRKGELIERRFKDKQYERVVTVLQDEVHGMKSGDMGGLRHLSAAQLSALSRMLNLPPHDQLRAVFTAKNAPAYDAYIHNVVLAAVRYVDVVTPQEAAAIILPAIDRVPQDLRPGLLTSLAHNAHAVSRPDLAADILSRASESPAAGWETAHEMAQSYRWSGNPAKGAEELGRWMATHSHRLSPALRKEARSLNIALALEGGSPQMAFDLCLEELRSIGEAPPPVELIEQAVSIALQCSRTPDLLPHLRRFVAAMPLSSMPLPALHATLKDKPAAAQDCRRWTNMLAQWSDWNQAYNEAFDHHLRVAVLGDTESRDRCIEVYDYLGRTEECCEMLLTLEADGLPPQAGILIARQLAELGRDDEARTRYEAWIKSNPADRDAHFQYACLLEDTGDETASRAAFNMMLKRFPGDTEAMKRLATACIRAGDHAQALSLYEKLPVEVHNHETLENYAMIADSLDDHAGEFRALRMAADLDKEPSVDRYLELADSAGYLDDPQQAVDVLEEGMKRLPQSAQLRLALADRFMHADRTEEAFALLTHESLKGRFEAVQALLDMSSSIGDAAAALAFIGDDIEKTQPLTAEDRLQLGVLHYNAGRPDEARRLFQSVPETKENLHALAEAHACTGNFETTVRLMEAHLATHAAASPEDWIFLGDIYELLGRMDEARRAYDHSIAILTADLAGTAAN